MLLTKENIDPRILCNVLAPIFICGFFGNIICIIVFLRRRFRARSISVYFIALFFNDCLLLFISHVAKMLIFDASSSCWFNIYLTKFIDIISYREMIYRASFSVLTYNTTYTQISMLIFMFMSIQRVRTFSSISYRESRICALLLTLIAFIYGISVSYFQLYDAFCIKELKLTPNQTLTIDFLMNNTKRSMDTKCMSVISTDSMNYSVNNSITYYSSLPITTTVPVPTWTNPIDIFDEKLLISTNDSFDIDTSSYCSSKPNWNRIRHRTIAHVYLQRYMSIDWPDEHAQRSTCLLGNILPRNLLISIDNLTLPSLQSRPGEDYFHEHQFCTQIYHFIGLYANCTIPLSAENFQNWYKFLYDRRLSLKNRYTIGFIIGTFIPSCICIISSFVCLYYISNRPSIRKHSHSRAELRSLSLILVEILLSLMSALQSYIINFFTCHRLLFRLETDNCYGQSSNNILPNFLGSILELFTSTSNILILMICGAQFRNELIEILRLRRFFPQDNKQNHKNLTIQTGSQKRPRNSLPTRATLPLPQNGCKKPSNIPHDSSIDSMFVSLQNRDEFSLTELELPSDETSQCLIKATTV
ncbi:hypothetical protein I4U23_030785 [Adineta vaga]|nr:hypothetical protein I4U23_030785 [Adineta vaga]